MKKEESALQQVTIARITAVTGITVAIITTFGGGLLGYLSGTSNANDSLIAEIKNIREENKILIERQEKLLIAVNSATGKIIDESKPSDASEPFVSGNPVEAASSESERQQAVLAIPIISRTGAESKFKELQRLLIEAEFKKANQKTDEVMNWIGQQEEGWINTAEAIDFECVDLNTIDRLWKAASYEKFGLSVQKKIYQRDKNLASFGDTVGWRINNDGNIRWKKYSELTFDLRAKEGHLPARNVDPEYGEEGSMSEGWLVYAFLDNKCLN